MFYIDFSMSSNPYLMLKTNEQIGNSVWKKNFKIYFELLNTKRGLKLCLHNKNCDVLHLDFNYTTDTEVFIYSLEIHF